MPSSASLSANVRAKLCGACMRGVQTESTCGLSAVCVAVGSGAEGKGKQPGRSRIFPCARENARKPIRVLSLKHRNTCYNSRTQWPRQVPAVSFKRKELDACQLAPNFLRVMMMSLLEIVIRTISVVVVVSVSIEKDEILVNLRLKRCGSKD